MLHIKSINGFTLIEILMALLVFIVASVSIWALYVASLEVHKQAIDQERMAWLAESLLAELRNVNVITQVELKPVQGQKLAYFPDYTYDILFQDLGNDAVGIEIKIYNRRYGQVKPQSFYTVLYRYRQPKIPIYQERE